MAEDDLTCETVRRLFLFEAELGLLIWNERPAEDFPNSERYSALRNAAVWNTKYAGKIAGCLRRKGYRTVNVFKCPHRAHRLIWFYCTGEWPRGEIDHIHGVAAGDVFENLRDATDLENSRNQKLPITNRSGVIGVCWDKAHSKWSAQIQVMRKSVHLGIYADKADAIAVRKAAEIKYGFHANHGRVVSKG